MIAVKLMTLPGQIAERIFAAVVDGEYAPGDRIREEMLAEQFEVSRGPVREALRILEKDSVVRILPNRGAYVTQLSIKEVSDIFEIRRQLVGAMVRSLGPDDKFIAWIDGKVSELEVLAKEPGAGDDYLAVSYRLGRVLAESAGNERLVEILGSLGRQTRRYSKLGLATAARRRESARLWRVAANAMKAGDIDGAAAAIEEMIDASEREAVRQLTPRQAASRRSNKKPTSAASAANDHHTQDILP
ncbi:GntR family transcriptional regulator [Variovorax sp. J22R133]|uniref:GntR family transcriptional regulator n=1 Tax=Variovorax brevis TaxID=3053503 RepID=UPI0025774432|nr:GntR family transcriptional regulator [Variovorax sp. J22R133]MDM0117145.1 GntR family transcriptional regulator [Variovorax sp. J22R133]